jgi:Flp pilus assembly protein TadD
MAPARLPLKGSLTWSRTALWLSLSSPRMLRGRAAMAQGDFAEARTVLEPAIKREPTALLPRVVLSHALLQDGSDLKAAETVLREILAISPTHTEARRNLAVLMRQLQLA